jgi:hypothetical protein
VDSSDDLSRFPVIVQFRASKEIAVAIERDNTPAEQIKVAPTQNAGSQTASYAPVETVQ